MITGLGAKKIASGATERAQKASELKSTALAQIGTEIADRAKEGHGFVTTHALDLEGTVTMPTVRTGPLSPAEATQVRKEAIQDLRKLGYVVREQNAGVTIEWVKSAQLNEAWKGRYPSGGM